MFLHKKNVMNDTKDQEPMSVEDFQNIND